MEDELLQTTASRSNFLRKVGMTLAIGLGVSAAPARALAGLSSEDRVAHPESVQYTCCLDDDGAHGCQKCSPQHNYYCTNNTQCSAFPFCYGCTNTNTSCFNDILPGCVVALRHPGDRVVGRWTL